MKHRESGCRFRSLVHASGQRRAYREHAGRQSAPHSLLSAPSQSAAGAHPPCTVPPTCSNALGWGLSRCIAFSPTLGNSAVLALLVSSLIVSAPAQPAYFEYGVASGDFTPQSIILWTRVTPVNASRSEFIEVSYFVSTEKDDFSNEKLVTSNTVQTHAARDWTVKVNVTGITPLVYHYFLFSVPDESNTGKEARSQIGRFRTFPEPYESKQPDEIRIGLFSCSNFGWGYFNAFGLAASPPLDVDIFNHVGDFIYEPRGYPDPHRAVRRGKLPDHECATLNDYRLRHASYRRDEGLQLISRSAPTIAMWDDHELVNNPWSSGPQPDLGLDLGYLDRKRNAQQAYHEWMPTPFNVLPNSKWPYWKDSTTDEPYWKAYRFVSLGNLGRLILPETRLVARTQTDFYESDARRNLIDEFNTDSVREALWSCIVQNQTTWNGLMPSEIASLRSSNTTRANEVESCIERARDISDTFRLNISKTMLGDEQHQWLEEVAQANEGKWTLISQEVVMQQLVSGDYESAVAKKKAENQQEGNQWGEILDKMVNGTVGSLYTELCDFSNSPMKAADPLRKPQDAECRKQLSSDTKKYTQVENVAARFNVTTYFDSWPGYMHDKERLLSEIDPLKAPNPIVLSGDSHDAWMGLLYRNQTDGLQMKYSTAGWRAVAPEYAGNSVSSPGLEETLQMPYEMHQNAYALSNTEMLQHQTGNKGLVLISLRPTEAFAEYFYVLRGQQVDYSRPEIPFSDGKGNRETSADPIECTAAFRTDADTNPNIQRIECSHKTNLSNLKRAEMFFATMHAKEINATRADTNVDNGGGDGFSGAVVAGLGALVAILGILAAALAVMLTRSMRGNAAGRYISVQTHV